MRSQAPGPDRLALTSSPHQMSTPYANVCHVPLSGFVGTLMGLAIAARRQPCRVTPAPIAASPCSGPSFNSRGLGASRRQGEHSGSGRKPR